MRPQKKYDHSHDAESTAHFKGDHRRKVREYELELVSRYIPPVSSIVEVGAGAGWQAKVLAGLGHQVKAIEIANSNYKNIRDWPVETYDGVNIPAADESVDVVFSSNVLEHVPHIYEFQAEMQRVLKPGGLSIHVMPTATWRLWTSIAHYAKKIVQVVTLPFKSDSPGNKEKDASIQKSPGAGKASRIGKALGYLIPVRHGERGNVVTEFYYFSELYWANVFRKTNWEIVQITGNGLFYSGQRIFGKNLPFETRRMLSHFLGSSCKIYVMKKKGTSSGSDA